MSISQRRNVRIISGKLRGSKLAFPEVSGLRPSGDRVRETLFAWLQTSIVDCRCLDMFAGSGALGFEAVSRGARRVVMLEKNKRASTALVDNAERLRLDNVEILNVDATLDDLYKQPWSAKPFGIVFIDPPFADNMHQTAIDCVSRHQLLAPGGSVYLETARRSDAPQVPEHWELHREKFAGEVRLQLYRAG